MSDFKVGDRVRVVVRGWFNLMEGTVANIEPILGVVFSPGGSVYGFSRGELEHVYDAFKVGDTVRIIKGGRNGETATIAEVHGRGEYGLKVSELNDNLWYFRDEFEPAEPTLEQQLEDAKKLLEETKKAIAEYERKLSANLLAERKNSELGTIITVDNSRYVKVAPNSWVLISDSYRNDTTHVFRDEQLVKQGGPWS